MELDWEPQQLIQQRWQFHFQRWFWQGENMVPAIFSIHSVHSCKQRSGYVIVYFITILSIIIVFYIIVPCKNIQNWTPFIGLTWPMSWSFWTIFQWALALNPASLVCLASTEELDEESRELNLDSSARIFRVLAAIKMLSSRILVILVIEPREGEETHRNKTRR